MASAPSPETTPTQSPIELDIDPSLVAAQLPESTAISPVPAADSVLSATALDSVASNS